MLEHPPGYATALPVNATVGPRTRDRVKNYDGTKEQRFRMITFKKIYSHQRACAISSGIIMGPD